jgi:hypothetical protein
MGHPAVDRDFRNLDAEISEKQLKQYLKGKRYKLGMYPTAGGTERYGIVPAFDRDGTTQEIRLTPQEIDSQSPAARIRFRFNCGGGWKNLAMYTDVGFFCFLLGILGTIIAHIRAVNNPRITEFFKGSIVGRRLLFAFLACLASGNWARLERGMPNEGENVTGESY